MRMKWVLGKLGPVMDSKLLGRAIALGAATLGFAVPATSGAATGHMGYVDPLSKVSALVPSRIDMGVDFSGYGPILAIGKARISFASANVGGPESCWGKTCAPPGSGIVVYKLLTGPFAGRFVYAVENITVSVRTGQIVRAGQRIAVLHEGSPNLELGWAAGHGIWTLAAARRHQCSCIDPGGWSSVEGRNFNSFLVWLGAPSGYLTSIPPGQHMPRRWPRVP
jgi:hypothetical protein